LSDPPVPAPSQPDPPRNRPARTYGPQAIIDLIGEGIDTALTGMGDGIIFIFNGFINIFKWIFRIDRK
jgi:hypothetical protein